MRFHECSPAHLSEQDGFSEAVADLRKQELPVFSGPASYNVEAYMQAWLAGLLDCWVAADGGRVAGFAIVRPVEPVRRNTPTMQVEAAWAAPGKGRHLWLHLRHYYRDVALVAVAPIGSAYDQQLARHATHTHNTYVFEPGTPGPAHTATVGAPPAG
jgi:hypothetical protein